MDADKAIFMAGGVTLASTVAASAMPTNLGGNGQFPPFKLLMGTSFTFLGISMLGEFAPGFAVPLSAALAVTALTYYGFPLLDNYMIGTTWDPVAHHKGKVTGRKGAKQLSHKIGVPTVQFNVPHT